MTSAVGHVLETPIGPLTVVVAGDAVRAVRFAHADGSADVPEAVEGAPVTITRDPQPPSEALLATAVDQLREYFAGDRTTFDLPLAPSGTAFQQRCWAALLTLDYGTTTTYGDQAARLGTPSAVRAVGAANGANPIPVIIPCHRIIGANGRLVGFGGGLPAKAWLLDHEQRVAGFQLPFDDRSTSDRAAAIAG